MANGNDITATNPKTGEKLRWDGKQWQPIKASSSALQRVSKPTKFEQERAQPEAMGFTPGNILGQAATGIGELVSGGAEMGKDLLMASSPAMMLRGPDAATELVKKYFFDPARQQMQQARATTGLESAGHMGAAALPIIGPWAAGLGEQAGRGDIGGAIARGGTQVLAGELGKKLPGVPEKVSKSLEPRRIEKATEGIKKSVTSGVTEKFGPSLDRAIQRGYLPEIERQFNPKNIREATHAVLDTASQLESKIVKPAVNKYPNETISGDVIAKEVGTAIRAVDRKFYKNVDAVAEVYKQFKGKDIPLPIAHELLTDLNAGERRLRKATPEDKAAAEKLDRSVAALGEAAESIRAQLYKKLESLGEKGIAEYQKDFGALKDIGTVMRKNIARAERIGKGPTMMEEVSKHPWLALTGVFGLGGGLELGHGELGAAALAVPFIKWAMDRRGVPNAVIERALGKLGKTTKSPQLPPGVTLGP